MNDVHSLSDSYVVGAVTPAEARDFEAHLGSCAECTDEVAEMRLVTARLSETVAIDPPPALRTSVLAEIAATPQETAAASARVPSTRHLNPVSSTSNPVAAGSEQAAASEAAGGREPAGDRDRNVVPLQASRTRRMSSLLVAAAAVAAIGLGGWALQSRETANDLSAQNEQIVQQNEQFTDLLSASDVRTVSSRFTTGGAGSVVMSESEGKAILVAKDLPELPDDKVYEAWTIERDPVPAGTFEGSHSVIELPDSTFAAQTVAVTVEPQGGSQSPTSAAIFTVVMPRS